MSKDLLDANLSPKTAAFLIETFGFDVVHQDDILPGSPTDDEVVEIGHKGSSSCPTPTALAANTENPKPASFTRRRSARLTENSG